LDLVIGHENILLKIPGVNYLPSGFLKHLNIEETGTVPKELCTDKLMLANKKLDEVDSLNR